MNANKKLKNDISVSVSSIKFIIGLPNLHTKVWILYKHTTLTRSHTITPSDASRKEAF